MNFFLGAFKVPPGFGVRGQSEEATALSYQLVGGESEKRSRAGAAQDAAARTLIHLCHAWASAIFVEL